MWHRIIYLCASCWPRRLTREVKALYLSTTIGDFGKGMMVLFEPIYLYTLNFSIVRILWFYVVMYLGYFFLAPLGAKFAKRFGYTKGIIVGSVLLVVYFLLLVLLKIDGSVVFYSAAILGALYKAFYWPGYHAEFARYSVHGEAGREQSESVLLTSLAHALSPFLGGLIIMQFGFPVLFAVVAIILFISIGPLLAVPDQFEPTPFSYNGAYRRLFEAKNRHSLLAHIAFGEEFIFLVIWPIFLYRIFPNFSDLGSLVTMATIISLFVLLIIGRETDHHHKQFLLRLGSFTRSIMWFLRIGATLPLGVFAIDTFSRLGKHAINVPWIARTYHLAQEAGVMRTILFLEMALSLGKLLAAGVLIVFFVYLPESLAMDLAFVLGGVLTLLYILFVPNPQELKIQFNHKQ